MKALLFNCKEYGIKVGKLANRPANISPEQVKEKEQRFNDCVVALITIEKKDNSKSISNFERAEELVKKYNLQF